MMDGNKLKPEFAAQGINLSRNVEPEITYTMMNFTDPTIGGSSKEKNCVASRDRDGSTASRRKSPSCGWGRRSRQR
ncbi:hypothetical protein ACFS07_09160 [Undibacterium arcticum]